NPFARGVHSFLVSSELFVIIGGRGSSPTVREGVFSALTPSLTVGPPLRALNSIQSNAIRVIAKLRSVGDDHFVANLQPATNFDLSHGSATQLHCHGDGMLVVRLHPEQLDLAVLLAKGRAL